MELRVICNLRFIKADDSIYDFEFDNYRFVKGGNSFDASIFTQNVLDQAGKMAMVEFVNYPFFYLITEANPEALSAITPQFHTTLNHFVHFIWFSKDNSVNVGNLFTYIPGTDFLMKNAKLSAYSNSKGNYEETSITIADLNKAYDAFKKYKSLASDDSKVEIPKPSFSERPIITDSTYHYADYNKNTRIERAFSFLTMARANSFLPLKIALYMSLLECLFTTDRQEVTHKVCERVALYLGGSYDEKLETYKAIKEAYDIRSGFFHGQDIDKKQDTRSNLAIHSQKVDNLLRRILNQVLFKDFAVFNGSNNERIEFFNKMVLG